MERIVEVIKEGEIVRMPEARAVEEDLFILRRVVESDHYEPELRKAGKPEVQAPRSHSVLETWRAGKFGYKKNDVMRELVHNFHWEIGKARKAKNISRKKLADSIGVSEDEIKTIEFGQLPRDDFVLINKIESYLGINLRKDGSGSSGVNLAQLQKMKEEQGRKEMGDLQKPKTENFMGAEIEIVD